MSPQYWLNLFNVKTWTEFVNNGANISCFKQMWASTAQKVQVGDYLICYITGIGRFVGVFKVSSNTYIDHQNKIHEDGDYPVRFKVDSVFLRWSPKFGQVAKREFCS
jgi:predicted RNA-binding protein